MAPASRNPALAKKIQSLQLKIAPMVPMPDGGRPHSSYPKTILHFWLLTEAQLDSIAHYYHQSTPGAYTNSYPATMNWDSAFFARLAATERLSSEQRIAMKRRKLGKFIGLRNCDTPIEEVAFKLQLLEAELQQNLRKVEPRAKWV